MKYIFVSGGVVSGLGKGITSAAIGTIRPQEHGEVFVTEDGLETDQDLGNEDVEAIPHVTDEIIGRIEKAGRVNGAQVVIVELGGTVGEYQNSLFFEASRILRLRQPKDVIQVHVTYLPLLANVGELKSKPAQQSVKLLNAMGIQPDFLVARSGKMIDAKRREKLAVFCNLSDEDIIAAPDLPSIYQVPLYLNDQKFGEKLMKKLSLRKKTETVGLRRWRAFEAARNAAGKKVKIAMVGKYFATGDYKLADSYVSVIEAIKQAAWLQGVTPQLTWVDSAEYEEGKINLSGFDGIIVPQGWGKRFVSGCRWR